jgi:NhaP-type Na+/H+ or K+/H+ antiporter
MNIMQHVTMSIFGGIVLGCLAASIEILCLPYFYDDPISEITVTIVTPYMLYWLCMFVVDHARTLISSCRYVSGEQVTCSGSIAIVILGLILSNYKTAMSSTTAVFMEK